MNHIARECQSSPRPRFRAIFTKMVIHSVTSNKPTTVANNFFIVVLPLCFPAY